MKILDNIVTQRQQRVLQSLTLLPHQRRIMNLDDIRSIGIIAHNLDETEQSTLNSFSGHMILRGIEVEKIELPAEADTLLDRDGLPLVQFIYPFVRNHYDLLIDTTHYNDSFGQFVSLKSNTYLRTGYFDSSEPYNPVAEATYDLLIRGAGPRNLLQYLTDILTYLTQIRK